MIRTYEVWKTVPDNRYLDSYYAVVKKEYTYKLIVEIGDELIQTGFKSYEAALNFIQVLQKLKG